MPKTNLLIENYDSGAITVEPQFIRAEGGPWYPRMVIPYELSVKVRDVTTTGESLVKGVQSYTILELFGEILLRTGEPSDSLISEFRSAPVLYVSRDFPYSGSLSIPLDKNRVYFLEEKRKGNIMFTIKLNASVIKHPFASAPVPERESRVQEMVIATFNPLYVDIPQSHWTNYVLPGLGYGKMRLVEIPIAEKVVSDSFRKALDELDDASRYFVNGDYDESVAHCRNAIQTIPDILPPDLSGRENPGFGTKVEEFLKQSLSGVLTDSKREALEKILKATSNLASVSHHPPYPDYFNRADADALMLMTTALLAYVGKLLRLREER